MKRVEEAKYYSVRMRASQNIADQSESKHISGGELISTYSNIKESVNILLEKALTHSRGNADFMQIQFEAIQEPVEYIKPLEVRTNEVASMEAGQVLAKSLLEKAGIPKKTIDKVYENLSQYLEPAGAVLVDVQSGERVDDRKNKGIRVSRIDWLPHHFERWSDFYHIKGNQRLREALALATKVSSHPAAAAELCWSDDPDYVTGYVASKREGYQRITKLKEYGDERGGRIFFVHCSEELDSYIYYLEKKPVFIQWEGSREEDGA